MAPSVQRVILNARGISLNSCSASRKENGENYASSEKLPTADNCRGMVAMGEVGSPFAWLLSQRASGVSVVRLSISPGKSTEMENEIAARVSCSAHRRGVREMRDLSTLSASLRSRASGSGRANAQRATRRAADAGNMF